MSFSDAQKRKNVANRVNIRFARRIKVGGEDERRKTRKE